ncbi:hypothetical protein BdWA1_000832 [Babesia duncani]|uniref:Transmembrane protein n=1 Tax=Babesia duncani TaxID=323732 RepID=A0AAD9UQE0_9APIC|nr:hypothetical protein BdWA1_000832 [Babesia duncani]
MIGITAIAMIDVIVFNIALFLSLITGIACVNRTRLALISNTFGQVAAIIGIGCIELVWKQNTISQDKRIQSLVFKIMLSIFSSISAGISGALLCFQEYEELEDAHIFRAVSSLFTTYDEYCLNVLERKDSELVNIREVLERYKWCQEEEKQCAKKIVDKFGAPLVRNQNLNYNLGSSCPNNNAEMATKKEAIVKDCSLVKSERVIYSSPIVEQQQHATACPATNIIKENRHHKRHLDMRPYNMAALETAKCQVLEDSYYGPVMTPAAGFYLETECLGDGTNVFTPAESRVASEINSLPDTGEFTPISVVESVQSRCLNASTPPIASPLNDYSVTIPMTPGNYEAQEHLSIDDIGHVTFADDYGNCKNGINAQETEILENLPLDNIPNSPVAGIVQGKTPSPRVIVSNEDLYE